MGDQGRGQGGDGVSGGSKKWSRVDQKINKSSSVDQKKDYLLGKKKVKK